jgi:uncharacterized protein with HEPN domain
VVRSAAGRCGRRGPVSDPVSSDQGRLDDMLDHLRDIREHLRTGWEVFSRDRDLQKVVAYDLMILGEAASKVSKATQKRNPKIPWLALANYRNQLIHSYGNLDLKDTWQFVQQDLRQIERQLARIRIAPREE